MYVDDVFLYDEGSKINTPILNTEPVISGTTKGTIGTTSVEILSYDPLFSKLVVIGADNIRTPIPTTFDSVIYITNANGVRIKSNIKYIEENKSALHHFEDRYGNWLNPRGYINPNIIGASLTERIKIYTQPPNTKPTLGLMGDVTNMEYEIVLNEKKRKINLLKPEYVTEAIRQFTELVKPKRPSSRI